MNKLFSKSKGDRAEYGAILNDPETVATANRLAQTGANVVHETTDKIKRLNAEGPYSFRVLGLIGGLAMIITNGIAVLPRFLTLNLTGGIIALYCVIFGIVIVLLEADTITGGGRCPMDGRRLQQCVRFYAKFLEKIWGRGLLYFFVGTLQISNWNLIDWIVGGFMMFVGAIACAAGVKVAHDLRKLRVTIKDEKDLKAKWKKYDKDGKGYLSLQDLTAFIKNSGITMTQNEVVAAYMAVNRNLDDKLSYQELLEWWGRAGSRDVEYYMERVAV